LSRQREWRSKVFRLEIVVHRGESCRADACGAAACFGRAKEIGAAKQVRNRKKKISGVIFRIKFEKG
jgi:hypothetical protein